MDIPGEGDDGWAEVCRDPSHEAVAHGFGEGAQVSHILRPDRGGALDLDGDEAAPPIFEDDIHFRAGMRAPMVDGGTDLPCSGVLAHLGRHEALYKGAQGRAAAHQRLRPEVEQMRRQTGVRQMHLGRLD